MPDGLTPEQLAAAISHGKNVASAQAVLGMLRGLSFTAPEIITSLLTAATAVIETNYAPEQRLQCLNEHLADTIKEWAEAAAIAESARATRQ